MNDVTGPPAGAARKRAFGRSLSDFRIEGATTANGLLPAEEKLLVAVARGEICSVSSLDWKKPEDLEKLKSDEQWRIRADFLRFLALGGDNAAPVHEKGVQLARAHIVGDLDLEVLRSVSPLHRRQLFLGCTHTSGCTHARGEPCRKPRR